MNAPANSSPPSATPADARRVVCGTDFSDGGDQASTAAGAVARRFRSSLLLAHVVEQSMLNVLPPGVRQTVLGPSRERLTTAADAVRAQGVEVEEEFCVGRSDERLVELGTTENARCIVVSSLGNRSAERWLLGSVSERTAGRATVPTLVVRDAAPWVAWSRGERPLKVFVAFNFTLTAEVALGWVRELQSAGPVEVSVTYVDWPEEERARRGGHGPLLLSRNPPAIQAQLERDLLAKATEILGQAPASIRVEPGSGRIAHRLIDLASEAQADVIVVGSHQYHGFERWWHISVSRSLLHHAPMSVAVVPRSTPLPPHYHVEPFHRALAATDFSPLGNRAIPYVYAAVPRGAVIKLVHVLPPWQVPGPLVPHYSAQPQTEEQQRQLVTESGQKLRALVPHDAEARGILTEFAVLENRDPATAICQEAEQFGAELICLGTRGHSPATKALLGSVAEAVMTHSRRPLLVVRPPAP